MVNLEWYRSFKAIYDKGTITSAADSLFISQPGVSLHLSSLESYMGVKLFDRVSKKMIPTEQGKVLYNSIIDSIRKLEYVEKVTQKSIEKNTITIRIGMCYETFQHVLEKHIPTFDFNLITDFSDYHDLLKKLEKGMNDIVVTPHKEELKGIEYIEVGQENILLVGSVDIEKQELDKIIISRTKDDIVKFVKRHKIYGTSNDNEHFIRFWKENFNTFPDFRANYVVPNFRSIINCLSVGSGISIVPDFLCKNHFNEGKLVSLWQGYKPIHNKIYLAFRKNSIYEQQCSLITNIFRNELS